MFNELRGEGVLGSWPLQLVYEMLNQL